MFAQTWAGKPPAPKALESTSIIRSAKLKRVHHNLEAIPIGETPEQRKQEFQEAWRKFYTWVRTAFFEEKGLD